MVQTTGILPFFLRASSCNLFFGGRNRSKQIETDNFCLRFSQTNDWLTVCNQPNHHVSILSPCLVLKFVIDQSKIYTSIVDCMIRQSHTSIIDCTPTYNNIQLYRIIYNKYIYNNNLVQVTSRTPKHFLDHTAVRSSQTTSDGITAAWPCSTTMHLAEAPERSKMIQCWKIMENHYGWWVNELYIRIYLDVSGQICRISVLHGVSIKHRWRDSVEENPVKKKTHFPVNLYLLKPSDTVMVSKSTCLGNLLFSSKTCWSKKLCIHCVCMPSGHLHVHATSLISMLSISFYIRCMLVVVGEKWIILASPLVLVSCKLHRHCQSNARFQHVKD